MRIDIDMDILAMVLDHGHDDSRIFDSAEFVLNFPQPMDFRSHEGLVPFTVFRKKPN